MQLHKGLSTTWLVCNAICKESEKSIQGMMPGVAADVSGSSSWLVKAFQPHLHTKQH
jgi:hypothetical protein